MNLMTTYFFHMGKQILWCFSCFYGNINYSVKKKLSDSSGRILVLDVAIDGTEYFLINLYNGNTEPEKLKILESLSKVLKDFQDISEKISLLQGTFIYFLTSS